MARHNPEKIRLYAETAEAFGVVYPPAVQSEKIISPHAIELEVALANGTPVVISIGTSVGYNRLPQHRKPIKEKYACRLDVFKQKTPHFLQILTPDTAGFIDIIRDIDTIIRRRHLEHVQAPVYAECDSIVQPVVRFIIDTEEKIAALTQDLVESPDGSIAAPKLFIRHPNKKTRKAALKNQFNLPDQMDHQKNKFGAIPVKPNKNELTSDKITLSFILSKAPGVSGAAQPPNMNAVSGSAPFAILTYPTLKGLNKEPLTTKKGYRIRMLEGHVWQAGQVKMDLTYTECKPLHKASSTINFPNLFNVPMVN